MKLVKSDKNPFDLRRARSVFAVLAPLLTACGGGGNDLACGPGTEQKGSQCVAKAEVIKGDAASDAETPDGSDASAPDGGGGGGSGGGGGTGGAAGKGDAAPPTNDITFAGITSAAPADSTPPSVPDGGTTVAPDSIRVTWGLATYPKDPSAPIHYEVQSALTSGAESSGSPYIAPPGATSFIVAGLTAGKKYYFKVHAVIDGENAVDKVGPTKELSATPQFDDAPPTFGGATSATAAGPKSVLVKWSSPAKDDLTSAAGIVYRVYWSSDPNGQPQLGAVSPPGASQVVVNGLPQPEVPYYFHAVAVDAAGNTDKNAIVVQGQTGSDTTPPVFGGCVSASDASATEATVTWAPAFDDTTPANQIVYKVYASDVTIAHDTPFSALQVVGTFTGGTSGRVSGLLAASDYRFICHALDSFGNEDDNRVVQTAKTKNDGTPPTFGGATKADPDPTLTAVDLSWAQATDDQSAPGNIVYNIYASAAAGGEDFTKQPLTTATGGVLGKTITKDLLQQITPHASNTKFYFVVRAEDETGNIEKNTTEVSATTLVSFEDDVQPIFNQNCAILVCHTVGADGTNPPIQGQDLDDGAAYSNIVNVVAREGVLISEPNIKRIDGTSKTPHDSYLWRKINGIDISGNQMPPPQAQRTLQQSDKDTIQAWIEQGALNN